MTANLPSSNVSQNPQSPPVVPSHPLPQTFTAPPPPEKKGIMFFLNYAFWGILFLLAPFTILILLSQNSLPGNPLYRVKRGMENVVLAAAAVSPATKAAFRTDFTARRFSEAEQILLEGENATVVADYIIELNNTVKDINSVSDEKTKEELRAQLRANLAAYDKRIAALQNQIQDRKNLASASQNVTNQPQSTSGRFSASYPTSTIAPAAGPQVIIINNQVVQQTSSGGHTTIIVLPTNTPVPVPTARPGQTPIPTNTPVPIPTSTPTPVVAQPTNTPVPAPTNTPVPTTRPNQPTNTPVPRATNTPVPNTPTPTSQPNPSGPSHSERLAEAMRQYNSCLATTNFKYDLCLSRISDAELRDEIRRIQESLADKSDTTGLFKLQGGELPTATPRAMPTIVCNSGPTDAHGCFTNYQSWSSCSCSNGAPGGFCWVNNTAAVQAGCQSGTCQCPQATNTPVPQATATTVPTPTVAATCQIRWCASACTASGDNAEQYLFSPSTNTWSTYCGTTFSSNCCPICGDKGKC